MNIHEQFEGNDADSIVEYLKNSCKTVSDAICAFDFENKYTEERVEELMLEENYELCAGCGERWWYECLEDVEGEILCEQCREDT